MPAKIEWHDGTPDRVGYYLAAWVPAGAPSAPPRVSELFFSPHHEPMWSCCRSYLSLERVAPLNILVRAWMPLPKFPKDNDA